MFKGKQPIKCLNGRIYFFRNLGSLLTTASSNILLQIARKVRYYLLFIFVVDQNKASF